MSYLADILEGTKLLLSSIEGLPPIKRRKRQVFWRDEKRVTLLSVSTDSWGDETFVGNSDNIRVVDIVYTIDITIMIQANDEYEQDPEDPLEWREKIRQKLCLPLPDTVPGNEFWPGCPSVWKVVITLGDVYNQGAMDKAYDSSTVTISVHSKEPVNG